MHYYYLKPYEIIKEGDEWTVDAMRGSWGTCGSSCEGYTVQGWDDISHCMAGWKVRRLIKLTKLGNSL